jgi:hypothetical protein
MAPSYEFSLRALEIGEEAMDSASIVVERAALQGGSQSLDASLEDLLQT